ncbi:MAG: glutamine synthetase, partial [Deltaproteobacteria bacterium]|nr:glutamine synthetase [Deltaproteobacteria bacterium]
ELNLRAKARVLEHTPEAELTEYYLRYLHDEKNLKAVTICFSNLEGRFHMLDYDKKFLLKSYNNLTFDGSSIRGFSEVRESDLRLEVDWGSLRWLPTDVFGPGKVIAFGRIRDRDGSVYVSDMRSRLQELTNKLWEDNKTVANVSVEIEGFLFEGINAEQNYISRNGFSFVSSGGYYNSLPKDPLRIFIDSFAEAQRAMGFENEKDHPEVAPSQFELNYNFCDALVAADQIQIYKLLARQVAANQGRTACFLPKPVANINGSGMHTNMSIAREGQNLFHSADGQDGLSEFAWGFVDRLLANAGDLCLVMNSSVNAYRRLDPNFEAPNQIKSSAIDRTSMVRIPLANKTSARIEVRTVSPDANPYLTIYSLIRTGLEGNMGQPGEHRGRGGQAKLLPIDIYSAVEKFEDSSYLKEILGDDTHRKYMNLKIASADRCPRELGTIVKTEEILFHHEVTNQYLWSRF